MKAACNELTDFGNGKFYIGASNRVQEVISFVNDKGYGGFEELIGLPAMFGGIIYMNAGIGSVKDSLFTIGKFITSVKAYDLKQHKVILISKDECIFGHRKSIFQNSQYVILGANLQCKAMDSKVAWNKRSTRLKFCKENFEYGHGCFGSCFSVYNGKILKITSIIYHNKKGGIHFGRDNCNWLINDGNGTFDETIKLIQRCERVHYLTFQKIKREVVVWE